MAKQVELSCPPPHDIYWRFMHKDGARVAGQHICLARTWFEARRLSSIALQVDPTELVNVPALVKS